MEEKAALFYSMEITNEVAFFFFRGMGEEKTVSIAQSYLDEGDKNLVIN